MTEGEKYPLENIINEPFLEVENSKGEVSIKIPTIVWIRFLAELCFYHTFCNGYFQFARVENKVVKTFNDISYIIEVACGWLDDVQVGGYVNDVHIESIKSAWINKTPQLFSTANVRFLPLLVVNEIKDTKDTCYLKFLNVVVKVSKTGTTILKYQDLQGHVFEKDIIQHHYNHNKVNRLLSKTPFSRFVFNISNYQLIRFKAFATIAGCLIHRYKNPAKTVAIILYDEPVNELNAAHGGSGKSTFVRGISKVTNLYSIPGKGFSSTYNHKWQGITKETNVVCLDDVQPNLKMTDLFNVVTEDLVINPKGKPEYVIRFEDGPKFLIASNYIIKAPEGYSAERRMHQIELGTHYGKDRTILDDFGHYFYYDWSEKQWNSFYQFMIWCIEYYIKFGLIAAPAVNLTKRRLISEIGIELLEFLQQQVKTKTKLHKAELYKEFITGGYVDSRYRPTRRTFTVKVKKFLEYMGMQYTEVPANTKAYIEIITEDNPIHFTTIDDVDTDYRTVDSQNKMTRMVNKMRKHFSKQDQKVLALDWETTGIDVHNNDVVSLALSFKPKTGFNVMVPKKNPQQFLKPLMDFFEDSTITKVLHNAKFDLKFFEKLDIQIKGDIRDTMVMDYLLDPSNKRHGLKELSKRHLNYQMVEFDLMTGGKDIIDVDTETLTQYAAEDADLTLQLYYYLTKKLKENERI